MDTRSKILTVAAALELEPRPLAIVTGYFDILRAEHARDLGQVRNHPLLVAVLPLAGELLPPRARAELVAALRVVDYVVIAAHEEAGPLIESLQPAELIRLEADDALRARQLIEHVHRRQTG
jgi:glycerol-3-phosphate cytidylyltransferase-like family protein